VDVVSRAAVDGMFLILAKATVAGIARALVVCKAILDGIVRVFVVSKATWLDIFLACVVRSAA